MYVWCVHFISSLSSIVVSRRRNSSFFSGTCTTSTSTTCTHVTCLCLNSRMIILLHMVKRYNSSWSRLRQVSTPHQNAFVYCPLGVLFDAAPRHLHRTTTAASTRGSITNGSQHNVAIHSTCSKHMNSHSNDSSIFTPSFCLSPPLAFPSALFF